MFRENHTSKISDKYLVNDERRSKKNRGKVIKDMVR